ncbi:MAG: hypothetical protein KDJ55_03930 [Rhodobiaceae bacterium]|nr:hypothetical protein [Rhodobiaceae bacterium]MCC0012909.1 hypothetical protein [Rhodobiaceae bacterium]MCC0018970.1 hypothetical protein [Rhodobiaceae bacterium]MCC0051089.1 hypothetical protein [Rhodobiaceae bacterium]MCC0060064.1 hypothetical protein [Rhodobiaceae bacterium]
MDRLIEIFGMRGDLAHLALFLWASGASGLLAWSLKQLVAANRRFDAFVNEIARINSLFHERKSDD